MDITKIFAELYKTHPLPALIDEIAARSPDFTYISIPVDKNDPTKGWRDLSISAFAQAINKAAWWLVDTLGGEGINYPALHFFLPHDLSVFIYTLAAAKAGYNSILCHPGTPVETHISINQIIGCDLMIFTGELSVKARNLCSQNPAMRIFASPPLEYWLETSAPIPFPYEKSMVDAWGDPFAIVHSSGTTGIPKPVRFTQGIFMTMVSSLIQCRNIEKLNYATLRGRRVATLVPLTIGAGLFHALGAPFAFGYTPVLHSSAVASDLKNLDAMMAHADISALITAPKMLPDLLDNPDVLQTFKSKIRSVIYPGAPLSKHVGDELSKFMHISAAYGSTETGVYPIYSGAPEDWEYYQYDPIFESMLQPVNSLGYHEIVLPRRGSCDQPFQSCFDLFPDLQEWRTRDIFTQHQDPNKKHLWRYAGRMDDFIHPTRDLTASIDGLEAEPSEMQAFLPTEMEAAITKDKHVNGAVICENRGGNLAIVIEPNALEDDLKGGSVSKQEFLDQIWPSIEAANELCPVPAAINKNSIIVADIPFLRGAKGYPQRRLVQELHSQAIERAVQVPVM